MHALHCTASLCRKVHFYNKGIGITEFYVFKCKIFANCRKREIPLLLFNLRRTLAKLFHPIDFSNPTDMGQSLKPKANEEIQSEVSNKHEVEDDGNSHTGENPPGLGEFRDDSLGDEEHVDYEDEKRQETAEDLHFEAVGKVAHHNSGRE